MSAMTGYLLLLGVLVAATYTAVYLTHQKVLAMQERADAWQQFIDSRLRRIEKLIHHHGESP